MKWRFNFYLKCRKVPCANKAFFSSFDKLKFSGLCKSTGGTETPSNGPSCRLLRIGSKKAPDGQKETTALKIEPPLHERMKMCLLYDGFFFFCHRPADNAITISVVIWLTK